MAKPRRGNTQTGGAPHAGADAHHMARRYLRWTALRAALHRGWWLVTSVYLVVDAQLTPAELVLVGAAQSSTALLAEVPAGAIADTVGRRWSLVVSHALMGTAMLTTGLVTDLLPVLATQMLRGLSWTFASGADVAWVTDEQGGPPLAAPVLLRAAAAELVGAAAGLAGVGFLASVIGRAPTMVLTGALMLVLGAYVAARFRETAFVPARARRLATSWSIMVRGLALVRSSRALLVVFAAAALVHAATDASGRLQPQRLVAVGVPAEPLLWFSALSIGGLLLGAVVLRASIADAPRRHYAAACAAGAVGITALALAVEGVGASAGVLLAVGVAGPLCRALATVMVNREASADVRATVHSLLAQTGHAGDIVLVAGVAAIAAGAGTTWALLACALLFALAGLLVGAGRPARR